MIRHRIYSEHLPHAELRAPSTHRLLARSGVEVLVAHRPDDDLGSLRQALEALREADLRAGIWPLLSDREGYWWNVWNLESAANRVEAILNDLPPGLVQTVSLDFEPPLDRLKVLWEGSLGERVQALARGTADRDQVRHARRRLAGIVDGIRTRGIEVHYIGIPPLLADFPDRTWVQRRFGVAWVPCDVTGLMLYPTLVQPHVPEWAEPVLRGGLDRAARRMVRILGSRASVGLGCLGTGKLENEPSYDAPGALEFDAHVVRRAGIRDCSLFCLEGLLSTAHPERWLRAWTQPAGAPA